MRRLVLVVIGFPKTQKQTGYQQPINDHRWFNGQKEQVETTLSPTEEYQEWIYTLSCKGLQRSFGKKYENQVYT